MKNGFTLIELLIVITLVATISVSSMIIFDQTQATTNEEKLVKTYLDIQRAASLYIDLNDSYLKEFREEKTISVKLDTLQSNSYLKKTISNPVTKEDLSPNYMVKLYVAGTGDLEYLDSCVIDYDTNGNVICLANSKGESCGCCDFSESAGNTLCK